MSRTSRNRTVGHRTAGPRHLLLVALAIAGVAIGLWLRSSDAVAEDPRGALSTPQQDVAADLGGLLADAGASDLRRVDAVTAEVQLHDPTTAVSGLRGRLCCAGEVMGGVSMRAHASRIPGHEGVLCTSEANGTFAMQLESGHYHLTLAGGGVPRGVRFDRVVVLPGVWFDLGDIELPAAVSLVGRVVDSDGQPMAGVRVYGCDADADFRHDVLDPDAAHAHANALSDARGHYTIRGVARGKLQVRAEAVGYAASRRDLEAVTGEVLQVADLVMRPRQPLRGFVVDHAGVAIADVEVVPGGGAYEIAKPRHAVRSETDGGFVLAGFGDNHSLTLRKPGFAPTVVDRIDAGQQPVRARIDPALRFAGRVVGAEGHDGTITIALLPGEHGGWVSEATRLVYSPQPLAADGSFDLPHVPPRRWMVSARVPGVGSVPQVEVTVPLEAPLQLVLVAGRPVRVRCIDEQGLPFVGVQLQRVTIRDTDGYRQNSAQDNGRNWCGWWTGERSITDAHGLATIAVPPHEPLALGATADQRTYTSVLHEAGEVPDEVQLVLPRSGALRGRVLDASLVAHAWLDVELVGETVAGTTTVGSLVDASGSFFVQGLLPGSYSVELQIRDCTLRNDRDLVAALPIPVISDAAAIAASGTVEVRAGQVTEVQLPAPVVGRLHGRVTAAGRAVPDALVFVAEVVTRRRREEVLDESLTAHHLHPHCTTDAEGRFEVLVADNHDFTVRVRRPSAPAWSTPQRVNVPRGSAVALEIALPAAAVRGSYDMSAVPKSDREFYTAQLYRLDKAAEDPFVGGHHSVPLEYDMQRQVLGDAGTFAFEGLQPGAWVLRLVSRRDEILEQRVLRVVGDELLELSRLETPLRVVPRVKIGLADNGLRLSLFDPDVAAGVFVARVRRREDGSWQLPALAPGRYLLQPLVVGEDSWAGRSAGKPTGPALPLTVHADGSTTPAELWLDDK